MFVTETNIPTEQTQDFFAPLSGLMHEQTVDSVPQDTSCSLGADIVLKRIMRKLFSRMNALQPSELDEEFIYQSALSYNDYLSIVKYLRDDRTNCDNLNKVDILLSNFISASNIRRYSDTNLFVNLSMNPLASFPIWISLKGPITYLMTVLLIVILSAWCFRRSTGMSTWKSIVSSLALVGFVQFYMQKHELLIHETRFEHCRNPSIYARIFGFFGYGDESCRRLGSANSNSNIAKDAIDYASELVFQPMIHLGNKVGHALEGYLNAFTGFNYFLAPVFPVIFMVFVILVMIFIISNLPYIYGPLFARPATRRPSKLTNAKKAITNGTPNKGRPTKMKAVKR